MAKMQVPSDFVPSVTQSPIGVSPMSAQPVQPMQNAAPGQMEQMGAVTQHLGQETTDIGLRIQNQLDDAMVKQAETGFLQNAMTITNGDGTDKNPGYLHTRGADAQAQYGNATAALAKAKQDALDGLGSDFQKMMFNKVANQHLTSFGATMADHRFQQVSEYSAKSANDRADTYAQLAANSYKSIGLTDADGNPTGDFNTYWNQAVQEAQTTAKVGFGADPNSPQTQALVKDKTTAIVQGVLSRMMDDHAYPEAKKFYDDQLAKGNIDERVAESMGNAIKTNTDREYITTQTNNYIQAALTGQKSPAQTQNFTQPLQGGATVSSPFGAPRPGGKTHDGVDYAVPVGTQIQAPADGKVLQVWQDDKFGGGLSMRLQHDDGSITGYAHLSAANYKPGDEVTQGQTIGLTGKSGNATGPCLHYTMTNPQGQRIDPGSAGQAPTNPQNFTDPGDLSAAIAMAQQNEKDPVLQREIVAQLEAQQRHYRVIDNEDYQTNTLQKATDYYYSHNGSLSGAPSAVTGALKPEDLYRLSQPLPQTSNTESLFWFATNPNFTPQDVVNHAGSLSTTDQLSLTREAVSRNLSQDKVQTATIDQKQLESALYQNHMGALIDPTNKSFDLDPAQQMANKQRYVEINTDLQSMFDDKAAALKRQPTFDEKQGMINNYLMNNSVLVHEPGHFTSQNDYSKDKLSGYAQLSDSQIPNAYVTVGGERIKLSDIPQQKVQSIQKFLIQRGTPPTWQNIAWWWKANGK